ncbi:MAG: AtpZ/AtpI family protein [Candidatus Puniceispirillales bacterium]|jgi:ATP synthase protein I|nr:AtpZ/AtpI family protein [Alphaproteobacteria bacterium]MBL6850517.1 AtpZ/AtpI family protein [Alphaproteobacteria bacterium]MDA0916945.1 AtpZ/AtpI family protein [Pseudomonadota bacterium]
MSSLKKDKSLTERIEIAIAKEGKSTTDNQADRSLVNMFSRVATELLAGLLIGAGVGWTIDHWLETKPWFLVIFFLLGGAAGILNLWRVVTGKGLKIGYFK